MNFRHIISYRWKIMFVFLFLMCVLIFIVQYLPSGLQVSVLDGEEVEDGSDEVELAEEVLEVDSDEEIVEGVVEIDELEDHDEEIMEEDVLEEVMEPENEEEIEEVNMLEDEVEEVGVSSDVEGAEGLVELEDGESGEEEEDFLEGEESFEENLDENGEEEEDLDEESEEEAGEEGAEDEELGEEESGLDEEEFEEREDVEEVDPLSFGGTNETTRVVKHFDLDELVNEKELKKKEKKRLEEVADLLLDYYDLSKIEEDEEDDQEEFDEPEMISTEHFEEISKRVYFFDIDEFLLIEDGSALEEYYEDPFEGAKGMLRLMKPVIDDVSEKMVREKQDQETDYVYDLSVERVMSYINDSFQLPEYRMSSNLFASFLAYGANREDVFEEVEGDEESDDFDESEEQELINEEDVIIDEEDSSLEDDGAEPEEAQTAVEREDVPEEEIDQVVNTEEEEEVESSEEEVVDEGIGEEVVEGESVEDDFEEGEEDFEELVEEEDQGALAPESDMDSDGLENSLDEEMPDEEDVEAEVSSSTDQENELLEESEELEDNGGVDFDESEEEEEEEEALDEDRDSKKDKKKKYYSKDKKDKDKVKNFDFKLIDTEYFELDDYQIVNLKFSLPVDKTGLNLRSFEFVFEDEEYKPEFIFLARKEAVLFFEDLEDLNLSFLKFDAVRADLSVDPELEDSAEELQLNGVVSVTDSDDTYLSQTRTVENRYQAFISKDIAFRMNSISFGQLSRFGDSATVELSIENASKVDDRCAILVFGEDLKRVSDENGVEKAYDYRQYENHIEASGLSLITQSSGGVPVEQSVIEAFEVEKMKDFIGFSYFSDLEEIEGEKKLYVRLGVATGKEKGRYTSDLSVELFCPAGVPKP